MRYILLALTIVAWAVNASAADTELIKPARTALQQPDPERVLFVGNSFFYYNDSLHNHVRRILAELRPGMRTRYKSSTIGGARLRHHNLAHLLTPGQIGIDKPFQLVVLAAASSEPLRTDTVQRFHADVDLAARQVRQAGAELALYMTHAYVEPHPNVHVDNFVKTYQAYVAAGNRVGALVIPVGLAFERAYQERPDIGLHEFFDGTHPSVLGTYLAACVVIASVYGISPQGAAYDAYGEVSAADAGFLQTIAWTTVREFYAQ